MRRRLNVKLLAGLIIGTLVFMISVYLLHNFQVQRNADGLITRADAARDEGDLGESIRLLARYLNHRPDDLVQAKRVALDAKTYLFDQFAAREEPTRRDKMQAVYLMEQAIRKKGYDGELRREAADFWYKAQRFTDAIDNLEQLQELATDEREMTKAKELGEEPAEFTIDDKLRYINCLRRIASPAEEEKAIDLLSEMLGLDKTTNQFDQEEATDPDQLDAYTSLATLMLRKRLDPDMAEKTLNQMVSVNPDRYEAYLNRSRLIRYIRKGEPGREIWKSDIQRAYRIDGDNISTLAALAQMYLELKEPQTARDLCEEGLKKAEAMHQKSALYNLLVEIDLAEKNNEAAFANIERGLAEVTKASELLWKKARLLLDAATNALQAEIRATTQEERQNQKAIAMQRFKDVEALYKPLKEAYTAAPRIEYLKARILMQRDNDALNATKQLAAIRELVPGNLQYDIDVYLSMGYLATRQYDLRLEVIQRILAAAPGNPNGHESYIQTLMAMGRNKEAEKYYNQLEAQIKRNGGELTPGLRAMGAQIRLKRGGESTTELTAADKSAMERDIREVYKNEDIPLARRQSLAIQYFEQIKDKKGAVKLIENILRSDPTAFGFWALRIQYAETKQEAYSLFEKMKQNVGSKYDVALRPMAVKLAIRFDPDQAPNAILRAEQGIENIPQDQRAALLYELGSIQLMFLKNRDEGLRLLEKAAELAPRRLDILQALYQDATQQTSPERINEIVKRIKSITTENDDSYRMVEAGRIIWMIDNGHISEQDKGSALIRARQLIEVARQNRPNFIPVMQMLARLHIASDESAAAIDVLTQAHNLKPGDGNIIRQIAQIYKTQRNDKMVNDWMNRLPVSSRGASDKKTELESLAAKNSTWTAADASRAVRLVKELVPDSSTTASDWLLRSKIELLAKQFADAEKSANRALGLDSANGDSWAMLTTVLANQGKKAEAEAVAARVANEVPAESRSVTLGRCYTILKDYEKAEASFVAAIQQNPKDALIKRMYSEVLMPQAKTKKAAEVIEEIINTADPVNEKRELQWAHRALARILADTGSYIAFNNALTLIEKNQDERGELGERDLALWAAICFSRPERESWDRALIRLDKVASKRPLNDDEMFMKAQLYEKFDDEGLWQAAKSLAVSVLARNPGNKRVVESYVKWLVKRGELSEAKRYATNNLAPSDVTRLRVSLHSLAKAGQTQAAVEQLKKLTPQQPKTAKDLSELLTLSTISEELGQYNPGFYQLALSQLQILVSVRPSEVLRLATVMGLHGDANSIQKALQLCVNANKQKVKDDIRAGVALAILRAHPDKWNGELKEAVATVGQWLDAMLKDAPDNLALRWRAAEYHDMLGNLPLVEEEYQAILNSPKFTNPIERGMLMNNLAYAMALNGKGDGPAKMIREAKQLIGPTADIIDTEGFVHFVRGDNERAIISFNEAIKSGPATGQKFLHLTLALDKKGAAKNAGEAWANAMKAGLTKSKLPPALHGQFDKLQAKYGGQS